MTIHVNIGEAKTRLSELIAAAVRGEEIVVDKAGAPQVRLVPEPEAVALDRAARAAKRKAAMAVLPKSMPGIRPRPSIFHPR